MSDVRSKVAHLYRRAGFGARPDELDDAVSMGYEATVESLLAGLTGPDPAGDQVPVPSFSISPQLSVPSSADPAARMARARLRQQTENGQLQALQEWWLNRMIASSTPLREKLTLLWSGHFATGFSKVRDAGLMFRQNQLFRSLGAGNFGVLTLAVARDPAMQVWLDTITDVAAHPNENFARELMELFTLGIGNYTESDVQAAARCFTGWSFNRSTGEFVLRPRAHDSGQKTLLERTGDFDGVDAVRIVTASPACSRFVVSKLWSHLAYPVATSDPVVAQLAPGFQKDLDVTGLLRAILLHEEFTGPTARSGLVKQPIEFVVGAARALGLSATPAAAGPGGSQVASAPAGSPPSGLPATGRRPPHPSLPAALRLLAQEPFNPPNVGGWPQNEYWLTTASSAARLQFATQLAVSADLSPLDALPVAGRVDGLGRLLSIDGWGQTTRAALNTVAADPAILLTLALCAPEYVLN
jgi:uncharacterized protein (DUF1800 family)